MKKKIINGILMVALLAATSTSFVSCKDNDEDVKTDLTAQLQKLNGDYQAADVLLNNAIQAQLANKANQSDLDAFKAAVADGYVTKEEFEPFKTKVTDDIADIYSKLSDTSNPASVASRLAALDTDVQGIQADLTTINNRLKAIEDALKDMVTSVTVNATSNSILSNSKIFPGLNVQFVGAAYGEPIKAKGAFPSKDAGLSDDALAGVENLPGYYTWKNGELIMSKDENENNAGKIYFTVNPSNIDPQNLQSLALVNSLQEDVFVIDKSSIKKCEDVLTWGLTRGDEAKLWEASVNYDVEKVKAIELKNVIDFSALKSNVKNIIKDVNSMEANSASVKSTSKEVLKETSQAIANLLNSKLPAMPAVAMKATWTDFVGERSVLSDYSIAATAYKPLSFNEFNGVDLGTGIDLSKIDNAFKKIIDNIMADVKGINLDGLNIKEINITEDQLKNYDKSKWVIAQNICTYNTVGGVDGVMTDSWINLFTNANSQYGWYDYRDAKGNGTTFYYTCVYMDADMRYAISSLINDNINPTLTDANNAIQDVVNQVKNLIKKADDYATKAKNLEDRTTDYLQSFINKSINLISTGRFLEPILLVDGKNGIARATGTYEAGTYTFIPTTISYELLAPAFKKYIAVLDKNGKVIDGSQVILTKGQKNFSSVQVKLTTDAAKIVYAAMDFRGAQIAKVYDVTVK